MEPYEHYCKFCNRGFFSDQFYSQHISSAAHKATALEHLKKELLWAQSYAKRVEGELQELENNG